MNVAFEKQKKIVILGGGESGVGAAILARQQGHEVFLSDQGYLRAHYQEDLKTHGIPFEEGQHSYNLILQADEIIKSPGIPPTATPVTKAREKGIPIISEIEFASRYTRAKMVCVTGSNGKTTTTSLIFHIFQKAGLKVGLGGNIGKSFARQVASQEFDWFVLELSSFQLEDMYTFRANIAILLNVTPDHLDRYNHSMQEYLTAKMRITQNQTSEDAFIYWADDPLIAKQVAEEAPAAHLYTFSKEYVADAAAYVHNQSLIIHTPHSYFSMEQELLALTGTHNLYNSLAAGIAAKLADITNEQLRESLKDFQGVEHRLEKVARVNHVLFINDSKATNVNSCWYALQSVQSRIILIMGGVDKGNNYSEIEPLIRSKVKALVFLGKDNSILHRFFDGMIEHIVDVSTMQDAVEKAYWLSSPGDTVLLSPCCASFDLFANYEDRGRQFKECVRRL